MMRGTANLLALVLAVGLSLATTWTQTTTPTVTAVTMSPVVDASRTAHEPRNYQRIISLTVLSDPILMELCEPERVLAGCTWSTGADAFKLGTRPRLRGPEDIEAILALNPDLVVASGTVTPAITRLREAGIAVFMLGDLTGWEHCAKTIDELGRLLRVEERALRLVARHEARLAAVAAQVTEHRPRAVWVAVIGDRLYGGTTGTSYHDLLVRAGCSDVAAGRYTAWPEYSVEDLLTMSPELIVTVTGQGDILRQRVGAKQLAARIIELPEAVAGDPGLGLVDAVEQLHAAIQLR